MPSALDAGRPRSPPARTIAAPSRAAWPLVSSHPPPARTTRTTGGSDSTGPPGLAENSGLGELYVHAGLVERDGDPHDQVHAIPEARGDAAAGRDAPRRSWRARTHQQRAVAPADAGVPNDHPTRGCTRVSAVEPT